MLLPESDKLVQYALSLAILRSFVLLVKDQGFISALAGGVPQRLIMLDLLQGLT